MLDKTDIGNMFRDFWQLEVKFLQLLNNEINEVSPTVHTEYRPYYDDSKQQAVMLRQLIWRTNYFTSWQSVKLSYSFTYSFGYFPGVRLWFADVS